MEWAEKEDSLWEMQKRGADVPALKRKPKPLAEAECFLHMFNCLGHSRPLTQVGCGPIPISEIKAYCDLLEFDSELRAEVLFYMQCMDRVWLQHQSKEVEKEQKRMEAESKKKGRK